MKLTELLLDVQAATEEAKAGLKDVASDLEQFAGKEADAKMNIKGLTEVLASLKAADAELKRFGAEEATAKMRVQVIGPTRSQLQDIIKEAESTLGSGLARSPGGSSSYGGESGLRAFTRDLQSLESMGRDAELVAKDIGSEIDDVGKRASSASGSSGGGGFGGLESTLARLQPALVGIGVVLLVTLAPALLAIVASALQAVTALGALAAAAAGMMLPAGVAMIAMLTRLADVMAAVTAGLKQNDAAQAGNESQLKQTTQAADAQAQALQQLKQARDQLKESEAAYTQAVADARQKIADAAQTERKDTVALADAQQNLREQTTAAYRAWADAIEKVKQDLFALENAQIGVEQSHLDLSTAVNKLKADMQAAGAVSTEYLNLFKRIQDVNLSNLNVGQLTREIAAVPTGASGTTDTTLKQDLLDIVKARLAEREATDKVATSQVQLNRDRQTELDYAHQGIEAYAPYRNAVRSVLDAQDALNTATEAYNKLNAEGVYSQQSVVSAERAVENAHYALANAQRAVGKAAIDVAQNIGKEQNAFQSALAILTPAEQQLVNTIIGLVHWFEGITRPFTDAIAGIANGFISTMEAQARKHIDVIQGFLTTLATNINKIATTLEGPKWEAFWVQMFQGANVVVPLLARAFLALADIFRMVAEAAQPFLISVIGEITGGLEKLNQHLAAGSTLGDLMRQIFHSLGVWLQLAVDVMRTLVDIMLALGPIGDGIVAWVDKAVRGINAFLESSKGKHDLQDFVKEFVPVIEEVVKGVAKLAVAFLLLLELAAPAIVPALKVLGLLFDVLTVVLEALNLLPHPLLAAIGYIATFAGLIWGAKVAWGVLKDFAVQALEVISTFIESTLIPIVEGIGEAIVGLAAVIGAPVEAVVAIIAAIVIIAVLVITRWKDVEHVLSGIWHNLEISAGAVAHAVAAVWTWLVGAVRAAVSAVVAAVKFLGDWFAGNVAFVAGVAGSWGKAILNGLKAAWSWIKGVGKDIIDAFDWITNGIMSVINALGAPFSAAWNWIANAAKDAINFLIGIINFFIRTWDSTPFGSGLHFSAGPLGHVDIPGLHIGEIPKLAEGGVVNQAMYALFGEAGPEAVIPLKADVLAELGKSIVLAMGGSVTGDRKSREQVVQHNEFNISSPPGTNPDPGHTLSRIATGMRQRGLGLVGMST